MPDLKDLEASERSTFFNTAVPDISETEITERIKELLDEHSLLSKSLRIPFYRYPEKIDLLEKILMEALA